MRQLLFFSMLMCSLASIAQEETSRFRPVLKANFAFPIAIGDNHTNDALRNGGGFQLSAFLLSYRNFEAGIGLGGINFETKISDGPSDSFTYLSVSPTLRYRIPATQRISVYPELSCGIGVVLSDNEQSTVTDIKGGFCVSYRMTRLLHFVTGAAYQYAQIDLETRSDLQEYYREMQNIQVYVGLQLDFNNKKKKSQKISGDENQ